MFRVNQFKDICVKVVVTVLAITVLKIVRQLGLAKSASQMARWKIWSQWNPKIE
jgi:hypothetical protein